MGVNVGVGVEIGEDISSSHSTPIPVSNPSTGQAPTFPLKAGRHFLAALMLIISFHATATPIITYVYDGDTVKVLDNNVEYKLRISDIDAPEKTQSYGLKSRRALMQLCLGANIHAAVSGMDKYQRHLGKLTCNGQDASLFMLQNGHAWFNSRYSLDGTLLAAEQEARRNKRGLWANKQQTPPWVWRHESWRKNHPH